MYGRLSEEQKQAIMREFDRARPHAADALHAASIAAHNGLQLTSRQWSGKIGADYWAAAIATLIMAGKVKLVDKES